MLRLFKYGQKQTGGPKTSGHEDGGHKVRLACEIRIQKEFSELDLPPQFEFDFNEDNLLSFNLNIQPDEGFWKGAKYKFQVTIPQNYPHEPPKIRCETKIYHPNIDFEGNVCLNILREGWRPIHSLTTVFYGLLHLFLEPNSEDPLNADAAKELRTSVAGFRSSVRRTLRGVYYAGQDYPKLISD